MWWYVVRKKGSSSIVIVEYAELCDVQEFLDIEGVLVIVLGILLRIVLGLVDVGDVGQICQRFSQRIGENCRLVGGVCMFGD